MLSFYNLRLDKGKTSGDVPHTDYKHKRNQHGNAEWGHKDFFVALQRFFCGQAYFNGLIRYRLRIKIQYRLTESNHRKAVLVKCKRRLDEYEVRERGGVPSKGKLICSEIKVDFEGTLKYY